MGVYYTVEKTGTNHIRDFDGIDAAVDHAANLLHIETLNVDIVLAALDKSGEYRRGKIRIVECNQ